MMVSAIGRAVLMKLSAKLLIAIARSAACAHCRHWGCAWSATLEHAHVLEYNTQRPVLPEACWSGTPTAFGTLRSSRASRAPCPTLCDRSPALMILCPQQGQIVKKLIHYMNFISDLENALAPDLLCRPGEACAERQRMNDKLRKHLHARTAN
jgi:hypothetical protein